MRVGLAWVHRDFARAADLGRRALDGPAGTQPAGRLAILRLLSNAYLAAGDLVSAELAVGEALRIAAASGDPAATGFTVTLLGMLRALRGELHGAAAAFHEAIRLTAERGGPSSLVAATSHVRLAAVLLEWGDEVAAQAALQQGLAQADASGLEGVLLEGRLLQARLSAEQGQVEAARRALDQTADALRNASSPAARAHLAARRADIGLRLGDLDAAVRWSRAPDLAPTDWRTAAPDPAREEEHLILAHVLLAQAHAARDRALLSGAEALADRVARHARAGGRLARPGAGAGRPGGTRSATGWERGRPSPAPWPWASPAATCARSREAARPSRHS